MLVVTEPQLAAWIALYAYPAVRILALLATAPVFNNQATPRRIRLAAGLVITVAIAPALPVNNAQLPVEMGSFLTLAAIAREFIIGAAMGFAVRLTFSAIDLAGDLIGLQMGLSFALFYDPQAAGQTSVLDQFLGLMTTLVFLALNGHLLLIEAVARSFEWLPPGSVTLSGSGFLAIVKSAIIIFSAGLLIALPAVSALLITNIALGVLTRAAPQLNLFALGFPITLTVGIGALILLIPAFAPTFQNLYEKGFDTIGLFLKLSGAP